MLGTSHHGEQRNNADFTLEGSIFNRLHSTWFNLALHNQMVQIPNHQIRNSRYHTLRKTCYEKEISANLLTAANSKYSKQSPKTIISKGTNQGDFLESTLWPNRGVEADSRCCLRLGWDWGKLEQWPPSLIVVAASLYLISARLTVHFVAMEGRHFLTAMTEKPA